MSNLKNGETRYRVSYTYALESLGIEGKANHVFTDLDKAIEYVNYKESVNAGKDFIIEKIIVTICEIAPSEYYKQRVKNESGV